MSDKDFTYEPVKGELAKNETAKTGGAVLPFQAQPGQPVQVEPVALRDSTFMAAGSSAVDARQDRILRRPPDPLGEIDILPGGEVYMSHVHVRRRLNDAFGPMGWALRPVSVPNVGQQDGVMFREFALIALGRVVATAIGSARYFPDNKKQDFGDVAESVKSNALTRCSKDLGIASECWDRHWATDWQNAFCVHVWVVEKDKRKPTEKVSNNYWRRLDAKPFRGELEPVADSPNQDRWRAQITEWRERLEREAKQTKIVAAELSEARRRVSETRRTDTAIDTNSPKPPTPPNEPPQTYKPEGVPRDSRPPVAHAPGAINEADRQFLIRAATIAHKTAKFVLHKIVMMDGREYFTFSKRVYAEMQRHFAARDRILIQKEDQRSGNKTFPHIKTWQVRNTDNAAWGQVRKSDDR